MSILSQIQNNVLYITLNRAEKRNAFNNILLGTLSNFITEGRNNPDVKVIVLQGNGQHFCAGADLGWMQQTINYSEQENLADATVLANTLKTLYFCPKPTIALVQGAAFGGGAGLVSACDIGIASEDATFCFSEARFGLIPAVISPYVIAAIGQRCAKQLFLSAEKFDVSAAKEMHLIHHIKSSETKLKEFGITYAESIAKLAPNALRLCKELVEDVAHKTIDDDLINTTTQTIAKVRVSAEAQIGLNAFLNKQSPQWN